MAKPAQHFFLPCQEYKFNEMQCQTQIQGNHISSLDGNVCYKGYVNPSSGKVEGKCEPGDTYDATQNTCTGTNATLGAEVQLQIYDNQRSQSVRYVIGKQTGNMYERC